MDIMEELDGSKLPAESWSRFDKLKASSLLRGKLQQSKVLRTAVAKVVRASRGLQG